jgi:hypothetical protein
MSISSEDTLQRFDLWSCLLNLKKLALSSLLLLSLIADFGVNIDQSFDLDVFHILAMQNYQKLISEINLFIWIVNLTSWCLVLVVHEIVEFQKLVWTFSIWWGFKINYFTLFSFDSWWSIEKVKKGNYLSLMQVLISRVNGCRTEMCYYWLLLFIIIIGVWLRWLHQ